jgi:IMP dehydrogenase
MEVSLAIVKNETAVCFDDVLLTPKYSQIESRHNIAVNFTGSDGTALQIGDRKMELPIFCAPMDTVIDTLAGIEMVKIGISPILHRYCEIDSQVQTFCAINEVPGAPVGAAVGATGDYQDRTTALYNVGCRLFCVDVAHGHHSLSVAAVEWIHESFADARIMAGNVATVAGFDRLCEAGATFVRCGIGGGAVCSTRIVTGHGVPTLQTILDCAKSESSGYIVADGGLRTSGDIVKAFAAGADFVMLGSMLACTKDSPGEIIRKDGKFYTNYRGMASKSAQEDWRGQGSASVIEGVESWREVKGTLHERVKTIVSGLRSGLSYSGCGSLRELFSRAEFVRVSPQSLHESRPHD